MAGLCLSCLLCLWCGLMARRSWWWWLGHADVAAEICGAGAVCRHEKDTAVILGKEQERLEEEARLAAAAAERLEAVLAAVARAANEPLRWAAVLLVSPTNPVALPLWCWPACAKQAGAAPCGRLCGGLWPPALPHRHHLLSSSAHPPAPVCACRRYCSLAELEGVYHEVRGQYREEYVMYNLAAAALAQVRLWYRQQHLYHAAVQRRMQCTGVNAASGCPLLASPTHTLPCLPSPPPRPQALPRLAQLMQQWSPLGDPGLPVAEFAGWRPLLESEGAAQGSVLGGGGDLAGGGDAYMRLVAELVLPPLRKELANDWDPRQGVGVWHVSSLVVW